MRSILKRLILRVVDYVVRVVVHRVDLIRLAQRRAEEEAAAADPGHEARLAFQKAVDAVARKSGVQTAEGWRVMRVRPFVFPASPAARISGHPKYFLVTSQGLAASAWLASSLNLHPEITCSMGIDHPLVSMRFYYNAAEIEERTASINDLRPITHGFYTDGLRQHFKQKLSQAGVPVNTDLVRQNPIRDLQKMYDELQWYEPKSRYYGNVHVCFALQALEYLRENPLARDVTLVNLIRHPVPRTEAAIKGVLSIATKYKDSDWHSGITEGMEAVVDTHAERRREIEKRFRVDFSEKRNRAVLYSYYVAIHNDAWAGEITSVPEACHVTIERLMSDRDYFAWLVSELTGGEQIADAALLDKIHSEEHLQSGRHTGRGQGRALDSRAQFAAWTDWEKSEFRSAMERLNLKSVYAPFGYDFSFVH